MRPKGLLILLGLGFVAAVGWGVAAQTALAADADSTAAAPDSAAAQPDTTSVQPDSVATTPVIPAAAPAAPAVAPTTQPSAPATQTPAPASAPPPAAAPAKAAAKPNERIYYGGTVTLSFGSTTRIGFFPMVGYMLTPKISGGVEVGYEYVDYGSESSSSYGGSVFGRFRARRNLYAHAEYQTVNYEIFERNGSSHREWVPFLLLGGGVVRPLGGRAAAYAEVLFDVLQDDRSPYGNWEPVVSVGVSVGF